MSKEWEPENVFEVLGSEVARQILALASLRPLSAAELAEHCDVSEPTVYRRVNALQEYDMLDERTELNDDGHHTKQFKTNLDEARFRVEQGEFEIDIQLKKDYTDKFTDFWNDLEKGAEDVEKNANTDSPHRDGSSSNLSGG
ncbi:helix-turn-helix domain-containing protein [Halobellus ruber]|uniref:Helix-turn-helix transcriptional regulator n=1 Tax=Halobellus ruber TaxID=2761102 RepID=A0A7J9SF18_9EURY|nr:helix-turn-helix transcriptional regulator [Halobellus ruber]